MGTVLVAVRLAALVHRRRVEAAKHVPSRGGLFLCLPSA